MSYVRLGEEGSDVYVFLSCYGRLECCGCCLFGITAFTTTTAAMFEHLREHRRAGHVVPDSTFERLDADAEEDNTWIRNYAASGTS